MSYQTPSLVDRKTAGRTPWASARRVLLAGVSVIVLLCGPAPLTAQRPLIGSYSPGVEREIRSTHVSHPWAGRAAGKAHQRPVARRTPAQAARPSGGSSSAPAASTSRRSSGVQQASAEYIVEGSEVIEPIPAEFEGPPFLGMPGEPAFVAGDCGDCGSCGSCRLGCFFPCLPLHNRLWVRGEYLLWWTKGSPLPPLVTTSPDGTMQSAAGVLGEPGTEILFGGHDLADDSRSGGRITAGWWLDCCRVWGLEFSYLVLEDESANFVAESTGSPILARPFFNVQNNAQDAELVAFPDLLSGRVTVDGSSEFESAEVLLRRLIYSGCDGRLDFLIGYRYARLDDSLRITENLVSEATNIGIEPGTTIDLFDDFQTQNDFNGVQIGVQGQWRYCNLTLDLLMKLGLGNTRSVTTISGMTMTETPQGETSTSEGGLLAQSTNIGRYENNEFGVMPELGVTLHYDFCCRWRASVGYTFLYWSNVMRAGEQIDFGVNTSQLPPGPLVGSPQPDFRGISTDFWAQGLNFGLEYQF